MRDEKKTYPLGSGVLAESSTFCEIAKSLLLNQLENLGLDLNTQFEDGTRSGFPLFTTRPLLLPKFSDFGVCEGSDAVLEGFQRRWSTGKNAGNLFSDDAKDFGKVLDCGSHLAPRPIHNY